MHGPFPSAPMHPDRHRQTRLCFGAVELRVRAAEPLLPFVEEEALYGPFRQPGDRLAPRIACAVELVRPPFPLPADARMFFDASPAWQLFKTPVGTRIITRRGAAGTGPNEPAADSPLLWTAVAEPGFRSVRVHCGTALCRPDGLCNPVCYPLDQILLLHLLAEAEMLLVHGACIELDGGAAVFAGVSGAGKTTLSRQFTRAGVGRILTDDRVLLARTPAGWIAGGTPWPGEGRFARNEWRPLRRLSFILKSNRNAHTAVSRAEALERLLPVLSIPWFDAAGMSDLLALTDDLVFAVPATRFECTADERAAQPALHRFPDTTPS